MHNKSFKLAGRELGGGERLFLIAGPCVVEDRETMLETAQWLARLAERLGLLCIFKASYLKANRSSAASPSGPGLDKGLEMLRLVKETSGLPICTDIHECDAAAPAAEVADVVQIPAFLCRQTELIRAAAATGRVVNIKKGQFLDPALMRLAVEKARLAGGERVMVTERGSFFGYRDLVVDFRSFGKMASECGCPVVFDVTHSVQSPGGAGDSSGGQREYVPLLARAAVAAGVDGIFLEVHPEPERALSDRHTMLSLESADKLLTGLAGLADFIRQRKIL